MNRSLLIPPVLFALACSGSGPKQPKADPTVRSLADVGLEAAAIDRKADPCGDFYQFACGGWLASHAMPADRSRIGRFSEIFDRGQDELKSILAGLATAQDLTPELTAVRDFNQACMDEATIEAAGTAPLKPMLTKIAGVSNRSGLSHVIAELHRHGVWAGFRFGAEADFKDANIMIAGLDQAGLGLPDRDYYTSKDPAKVTLRNAYIDHVVAMLILAGWSEQAAKDAAATIIDMESRLALASKTRVERRDIPGMYNRIDRAGISGLAPRFDWKAYFAILGKADLDGINVGAPDFIKQLGVETEKTPLSVWRDYLAWHYIRASAASLSKPFVDEAFAMASKISGQKEQRPRWKRCLQATNGAVGEFLAVPFLERMFPGKSKASAIAMVGQISDAFSETLGELDWMSAETKAKAAEKRAAMSFLIGYPDKLKKYDFPVSRTTFAANVMASRAWEQKRIFNKIGKPTDRGEWYMLPQTVNAYYDPQTNQMGYPAGILQRPFFSVEASTTVNLGALGMIVGHELTHGFDDQGAQFAANGNMSNWWQPEDLKKFEAKGQCVVDQYAKYEPLPGKPVNG